MEKEKDTLIDIITAVAEKTGINREVIRIIAREIFKETANRITSGKNVVLPRIGKFIIRTIKEKKIKTLTGETIIKNWKVLRFLPSRTLKNKLNK